VYLVEYRVKYINIAYLYMLAMHEIK